MYAYLKYMYILIYLHAIRYHCLHLVSSVTSHNMCLFRWFTFRATIFQLSFFFKQVSEYDQEIQQSHTADQPTNIAIL